MERAQKHTGYEYEPQLAQAGSLNIVHPAHNRHYGSSTRRNHPRGGLTGVGLTLGQVSVPSEMKSITMSSRYHAQRDKIFSYCPHRADLVGVLVAITLVKSMKRAKKSTAPSAISHDLPITLGNDPGLSCALAGGSTARAVWLPDLLRSLP